MRKPKRKHLSNTGDADGRFMRKLRLWAWARRRQGHLGFEMCYKFYFVRWTQAA